VKHVTLMALGTLGLALVGCREKKLAPSPPRASGPWVDTLPPVPTSFIDVPVRYNLAPALAWLEAAVPRALGNLADRRPIPGKKRMHYAFELERQPFRVEIEGRTASVVASIRYQGRAWYDPPVLPEISASCGVGTVRPRARVAVVSSVDLTEQWTLRPRTRALATPLTSGKRDRCKVTAFRIDVTDRALGAAQAALQKQLSEFDRRVTRFDLRTEARRYGTFCARRFASPTAYGSPSIRRPCGSACSRCTATPWSPPWDSPRIPGSWVALGPPRRNGPCPHRRTPPRSRRCFIF